MNALPCAHTAPWASDIGRAIAFVERMPCPEFDEPNDWTRTRREAVAGMKDAAGKSRWAEFVLAIPESVRLRVAEKLAASGLPLAVIRPVIAQAWCATRADEAWTQPRIIRLFRSVGYLSEGGETRPDAPLLLFRGAERADACGLSWTSDPGGAAMYAWLHYQDALAAAAARQALAGEGGLFGALLLASAPSRQSQRESESLCVPLERPRVWCAFVEPKRLLGHFFPHPPMHVEEYVIDPLGLAPAEVHGQRDPLRAGAEEWAVRNGQVGVAW